MALVDDLSVAVEKLNVSADAGLFWEARDGRATVTVAANEAGKRARADISKAARALGYDVRYRGETGMVVAGQRSA